MVKIYKKDAKLVVNVPYEVIAALDLKDQDEVDFFKYSGNSFLFAKKADIVGILTGRQEPAQEAKQAQPVARFSSEPISDADIAVLKKLDTLRYNDRTEDKVEQLLNDDERRILQRLIKRKAVSLFTSTKSRIPLYGISKNVYDTYLLRKKTDVKTVAQPAQQTQQVRTYAGASAARTEALEDPKVKELEEKGFIVVPTEAEAATVSLALEDSIRHGTVLGTRSFNKKFYIVMRTFLERHSSRIVKALRSGGSRVGDVAGELSLDEEAVRGILYLLAENGDVSEKRRDVFELV